MFELHPRLDQDCIHICTLDVCQVLLMNDSRYPWIILVPEIENMRDLHHLPENAQLRVYGEINKISKVLESIYQPEKMNVAALGNMVPQLHIHIIARFKNDDAWPAPVWGKHEAIKYQQNQLDETILKINSALRSYT